MQNHLALNHADSIFAKVSAEIFITGPALELDRADPSTESVCALCALINAIDPVEVTD